MVMICVDIVTLKKIGGTVEWPMENILTVLVSY